MVNHGVADDNVHYQVKHFMYNIMNLLSHLYELNTYINDENSDCFSAIHDAFP